MLAGRPAAGGRAGGRAVTRHRGADRDRGGVGDRDCGEALAALHHPLCGEPLPRLRWHHRPRRLLAARARRQAGGSRGIAGEALHGAPCDQRTKGRENTLLCDAPATFRGVGRAPGPQHPRGHGAWRRLARAFSCPQRPGTGTRRRHRARTGAHQPEVTAHTFLSNLHAPRPHFPARPHLTGRQPGRPRGSGRPRRLPAGGACTGAGRACACPSRAP